MEKNIIQRLRNPPTTPFDITSLPDLRLSIDLFLANMNSSINSFNANRNAILRQHPEDKVPLYAQMKCLLGDGLCWVYDPPIRLYDELSISDLHSFSMHFLLTARYFLHTHVAHARALTSSL